ncbi:MAG: MASE1 domain-containing protein [Chloroflexaceae bacterium]|nr:MASE1 domain-containing protein [Chloroflexaceae bacterium]
MILNALLCGVYVVVASLGLLFATAPNPFSPVWPLSGVVFLALFQGGLWLWPGVFVGEMITGIWIGIPVPIEIGIAVCSTLEAVIGVALLRPLLGPSFELDALKEVLAFIAVTMLISVPLAATGASALFILSQGIPGAEAWRFWRTWWIGDVMGVLTVAPALVALQRPGIRYLRWNRIVEVAVLYGLLITVTGVVMRFELNYAYVLFVFVIWAALRFGPHGAAVAIGVISILTIGLTRLGNGPFVVAAFDNGLFFLQTFLAVLVVTGLIMSALVAERERRLRATRLLADVGGVLTKRADEAQMLDTAARHIAAWVDGCCIDLLERDGRLQTVAAACLDPGCKPHLTALRQIVADPAEPYLLTRVIQERRPLMLADPDQDLAVRITPGGARRALWSAIRPTMLIAAPLIARDQPLGALLLFSNHPAGIYRRLDLEAVQELAERLTQALVTARLSTELARLNRFEALGQLASGIAHDFNNLLTVIEGHSELALDSLEGDHPARADLDAIRSVLKRGKDLVRELQIIGQRGEVAMQRRDLNELVRQTDLLLRPLLGKDVELIYRLAPDALLCQVEPVQFERVLVNLVKNARDAMPSGGRITISTGRCEIVWQDPDVPELAPGRYVQLTVRDTGSGIAPEVAARIFEPYFTTKGPGKGAGLGLTISYSLIRQMRGTITLQSEVGRGAEFVIYLPELPAEDKTG